MYQPDAAQRQNARIMNWNMDVAKSSASVVSKASAAKSSAPRHPGAALSRQPSKAKKNEPIDYDDEGPTLLDNATNVVLGLVGLAAGAALTYSMAKDTKTKTTETAMASAHTISTQTTAEKPNKSAQATPKHKSYGPSASRTGHLPQENAGERKSHMAAAPFTDGKGSRANSRARRAPSQVGTGARQASSRSSASHHREELVDDFVTVVGSSQNPRGFATGGAADYPDDFVTVVGSSQAPGRSARGAPGYVDDFQTVVGSSQAPGMSARGAPGYVDDFVTVVGSSQAPGRSARGAPGYVDDFQTVVGSSQAPGMSARGAPGYVDDFVTVVGSSQAPGRSARGAPGYVDDFQTVVGSSRGPKFAAAGAGAFNDDFVTVADASQKYGSGARSSGASNRPNIAARSAGHYSKKDHFDDFETVADASQQYGRNMKSPNAGSWNKTAAGGAPTRGHGQDWETVVEQDRPLMTGIEVADDFVTVVDQGPRNWPAGSVADSRSGKPQGIHINTGPNDWQTYVDDGDQRSQAGRQFSDSTRGPPRASQRSKLSMHSTSSRSRAPSKAPSKAPSQALGRTASVRSSKGAMSTVSMSSKLTARTAPSDFNKWDTETVLPNDSISCVGR
ncbi:hypothetical protein BROUX41_006274 [Berkeleyomyces rouxiae]